VNQTDFLNQYYGYIDNAANAIGLLTPVALAQAFIESADAKGNFGQNPIALNGNNYFGIKSGADFKTYGSVQDSIDDYINLIGTDPRYTDVVNANDVAGQADAIQAGGYAGDSTTYSALIQSVVPRVQKLVAAMPSSDDTPAPDAASTPGSGAAASKAGPTVQKAGTDLVKQLQQAANDVVKNAGSTANKVEGSALKDGLILAGSIAGIFGLGWLIFHDKK